MTEPLIRLRDPSPRGQLMQLFLPGPLVAWVRDYARQEDVSVTTAVRILLTEARERHESEEA